MGPNAQKYEEDVDGLLQPVKMLGGIWNANDGVKNAKKVKLFNLIS